MINDTELKVIRMRFGLDGINEHSLQQIADAIGVSKQRVHKIERSALKQLSRSERLREHWEELWR